MRRSWRRPLRPAAFLAAAALALAGCARDDSARGNDSAAPQSRIDSAATGASTSAGLTPGSVVREIYLDSVAAGNPLTVHGRARTFENTVQIRASDANGTLISEVYTTSVGEMGHHNPFTATLWLTRPPGPNVIVEAFEYSAKDGSVRSLVADTLEYAVPAASLTLVFPVGDCTRTTAFTRSAPRTRAVARLLMEALVAGPDSVERAAGATSPFPRGARVNSVVLRGDEITVDFNERLQNVGGACAAQGIRAAVTETLMQFGSVRRVVITAAGSRDLALQP
jgi:hypothetical protein